MSDKIDKEFTSGFTTQVTWFLNNIGFKVWALNNDAR